MRKKYALTFAILLTLVAVNMFFIFNNGDSIFADVIKSREQVTISRAIDGDTLRTQDGKTIRLLNINTPEKKHKGYEEAHQFLAQLENKTVEISYSSVDKYGRELAKIYTPDYLNLRIVELGLGNKFLVDESELKDFDRAEKSAVENSRGLWEKSKYFGCFKLKINAEEEIISIESECGEIVMTGWLIKDESRKEYKFGSVTLSKLNIHSSTGKDDAEDVYWRSAADIWNNDRDTVYIFDAEGRIAHHESYGY